MPIELPEEHAEVFREGLTALNQSGVPYVVGGAFAAYHYTGIWRNTHDLDVYMVEECVPSATQALVAKGFADYGEMAAGDRDWIYHAVKNGIMLDVIWETPNHLGRVDESFHGQAASGSFLDVPVRFLSPDDLIWTKIFTMNRQRCDWPDIFQVIRARPPHLDWDRLLERIGGNWRVLLACLTLYDWVYPPDADAVPGEVRECLVNKMLSHQASKDEPTREILLDPWIYTRGQG